MCGHAVILQQLQLSVTSNLCLPNSKCIILEKWYMSTHYSVYVTLYFCFFLNNQPLVLTAVKADSLRGLPTNGCGVLEVDYMHIKAVEQ